MSDTTKKVLSLTGKAKAVAASNVFSNDGTFVQRFKAAQMVSDEKKKRFEMLLRRRALEARIVSHNFPRCSQYLMHVSVEEPMQKANDSSAADPRRRNECPIKSPTVCKPHFIHEFWPLFVPFARVLRDLGITFGFR